MCFLQMFVWVVDDLMPLLPLMMMMIMIATIHVFLHYPHIIAQQIDEVEAIYDHKQHIGLYQ